VLSGRGRPAEARVLLRHAYRIAVEHELTGSALRAANNACVLAGEGGEYQEELKAADEGVELARRLGNKVWEQALLACSIHPLVCLGRWDEAIGRAVEVESQYTSASLSLVLPDLAEVVPAYAHRGDTAGAERIIALWAGNEDSTDVQISVAAGGARSLLHLVQGRHADALESALVTIERQRRLGAGRANFAEGSHEIALSASLALGDRARFAELLADIERRGPGRTRLLRAQAQRYRARAAAAWGGPDEPGAAFERAVEQFTALEMPFWAAVVRFEHAGWLLDSGRADAARPLLTRARAAFEALGAAPWLERVDLAADGAGQAAPKAG
jgi:hypothetical protein